MMKNNAVIDEFLEYLKGKIKDVPMLSDEQHRIVDSDGTLVVSAGAGSGKTTVLALRFMRLLLEDKALPDEILTLTFTKKAAREMYERIYDYAVLASDGYPIIKNNLRKFASATISTLDAFNSEIARTASPDYGIARDFELLSENDEFDLVRETAMEVLSEHQGTAGLLYNYFSPVKIVKDLFLPLSGEIVVMSEPDDVFDLDAWLHVKTMLIEHVLVEFSRCRSRLIELHEERPEVFDSEDNLKRLCAYDKDRISAMSYSELMSLQIQKDKYTGKKMKIVASISSNGELFAEKTEANRLCTGMSVMISMLASLKSEDDSFWKDISELFIDFASRLNDRKKRMGQLTYKDIESLALKILKENQKVRQYFKKKFKFIMIDEFQDNTEKQKELVYILAEKNEVEGHGVPEVKDLDPGKLFFVGDSKQSIYLFRGADVSVFNKLNMELEDIRDKDTVLKQNFRSEPRLINHFNKIFNTAFSHEDPFEKTPFHSKTYMDIRGISKDDMSTHEASFEALTAREAKSGIDPQIVFMDMRQEAFKEKDVKPKPCEAKAVVDMIAQIVNPENIEWYIPDKEGPRAPRYSDIAVLYPKTSIQNHLETQLASRGIPYAVDGSRSIMSGALANDLYAYMRLIVYRKDKNAYMSVLRSPFVNLSYDGIAVLSPCFIGNGKSDPELCYEAFSVPSDVLDKLNTDDRRSFDSAAVFFDYMKELSQTAEPHKLLESIFYESGYWEKLISSDNGDVDVEQFEPVWNVALESDSIADFLSQMELFFNDPFKVPKDMLRFSDKGVKLMTIHKSKGLDFPIVIVCNIDAGDGNNDDCLVRDPEGHFISFYKKRADEDSDGNYRNILKKRRIYCKRAEKKRLLYVALTRAKTHLVVSGARYDKLHPFNCKKTTKEEKEWEDKKRDANAYESISNLSIGNIYREAIENIDDITRIEYPFNDDELDNGRVPTVANDSACLEKEIPDAPEIRCRLLKSGVKEFGSIEYDPHNTNKENDLGNFPELEGDLILTPSLASDFGTLCHETLESRFADDVSTPRWKGIPLDAGKCDLVERAASSIADRFFNSKFFDRYLKNVSPEHIHPEFGFMMKDDKDGNIVLEGSVDLFVEREDCNIVADYKTDRYRNPDDHKAQLTRYCDAMKAIFGDKKTVGYVVYLRTMDYDLIAEA